MGNERVVELDQYEFNTVITLINEKRNNMIKEKQNPEYITEILTKVIKAPTKKKCEFKFKKEREMCER